MELIYIWIKESSNGFIKEEGFNFYGEHKFEIEKYNGLYYLNYEKIKVIGSRIYKDTNIQNISAIVGENGSGKTTILKEILNFGLARESSNEKKQGIRIFLNSKKQIVIYENLPKDQLIVNITDEFQRCSVNKIKQIKETSEERGYHDAQSKVYLTNSIYGTYNSYSNDANIITRFGLSSDGMLTFAKSFFLKKSGLIGNEVYSREFMEIQKYLFDYPIIPDLQKYCDIAYYNTIKRKELDSAYMIKRCKNFFLNFYTFPVNNIGFIKDELHRKNMCSISDMAMLERNKNKNTSKARFFLGSICANLIIESIACLSLNLCIEDGLEEIYLQIVEKVKGQDSSVFRYYQNAIVEIEELRQIILTSQEKEEYELDLERGIEITIEKNANQYWEFCEWIDKLMRKKHSFILKYMTIRGLNMSSGERAMQNIFSRLNILPFFNELLSVKYAKLGENLLLLIDEIDLYVHPEWQRKIVSYMIDELGKQFSSNSIQIIMTTHSPIVLSDIPNENIIYLKSKDNEFKVHMQTHNTFGANIHTLLKNSFFLNHTMGEFAREKIIQISLMLESGKQIIDEEEYEYAKMLIDTIGEPIIKNHLKDKLKIFMSKEERIQKLEEELRLLRKEDV